MWTTHSCHYTGRQDMIYKFLRLSDRLSRPEKLKFPAKCHGVRTTQEPIIIDIIIIILCGSTGSVSYEV